MSETTTQATNGSVLIAKVRNQLTVAQQQWVALPGQIKKGWEQVGERVRTALDLPTKAELSALAARLDEIDARLSALLPDSSQVDAPKTVAEKRSKKR